MQLRASSSRALWQVLLVTYTSLFLINSSLSLLTTELPIWPWSDLAFPSGHLLSSVITTESWQVWSITVGSRIHRWGQLFRHFPWDLSVLLLRPSRELGLFPQLYGILGFVWNSPCYHSTFLYSLCLLDPVFREVICAKVYSESSSPQCLTAVGQLLSDLHKNLEARVSGIFELWFWFFLSPPTQPLCSHVGEWV